MPTDGARDIPDVSLFAGNGLTQFLCDLPDGCQRQQRGQFDLLRSEFSLYGLSRRRGNIGVGASVCGHHGAGEPSPWPPGQCQLRPLPDGRPERRKLRFQHGCRPNEFELHFLRRDSGEQLGDLPGGLAELQQYHIVRPIRHYGFRQSGSAAYPTTAGYDLATGLGSVNVANLVNNWKSNFTPSTTTLSLSTNPATNPITLTHGQPINFTINVTSGSGTPSGDVSLIAQTGSSASNVTGIGPFTLSGGSVSGSTIMLPGGSYNVTAHYAGNGTFAASDSTPGIPVTVSKESSQTEIRLVTLQHHGASRL